MVKTPGNVLLGAVELSNDVIPQIRDTSGRLYSYKRYGSDTMYFSASVMNYNEMNELSHSVVSIFS